MPNKVIKRSGEEQEFQVEKLRTSLEKAAREAGYSEDEIFRIVEEISSFVMESVSDLETVDTQSMRTLILSELDKRYPEISEAWRNYDRTVKGRTD